jgi:hypothetical protein
MEMPLTNMEMPRLQHLAEAVLPMVHLHLNLLGRKAVELKLALPTSRWV